MSNILQRNGAFIRLLYECPPRQRKSLIQYITDDQLRALSQIALNVLQGNVPITDSYKKKLKRYKDVIRSLASRQISKARKRRALLKFHTVVPLLIKPALPLLNG